MPMLDDLRLRTGQLATEDWYDELVDYLEQIGYGGIISAYGYIIGDLIQIADLLLNLGIPLKQFKEIHVGYVYAKGNMWINGQLVLKDGDCITVGDLGTSAVTKITQAVDASGYLSTYLPRISGYEAPLHPDLLVLIGALKPVLSGYRESYSAPSMSDCFAADLVATLDGRFRFKFVANAYVYAYVKHQPLGFASAVVAALNSGSQIPSNTWNEFDLTAMIGDKANFRIMPTATVSILIYNIGNA